MSSGSTLSYYNVSIARHIKTMFEILLTFNVNHNFLEITGSRRYSIYTSILLKPAFQWANMRDIVH